MEKVEAEIKKLLPEFGYKLETMIGIDFLTAAGLIAEIGYIDRFKSSDKLAKYAGIAPVNYSSGSKERILKNRQGNRDLYTLFHRTATLNINCGRNKANPVNGIFYDYYQKKISQGKTKHQAIVCIMRRMVNIIYGMMKNKTTYQHPILPKQSQE